MARRKKKKKPVECLPTPPADSLREVCPPESLPPAPPACEEGDVLLVPHAVSPDSPMHRIFYFNTNQIPYIASVPDSVSGSVQNLPSFPCLCGICSVGLRMNLKLAQDDP